MAAYHSADNRRHKLTSFRVRRVKCDETKPDCQRCTSTGRTCNGYDNDATVPRRTPTQLTHPSYGPLVAIPSVAPLTQPHWHAAAALTPGLRPIWPSPLDLSGTETERSYFHDLRHAAEAGLSQHVAHQTPFWTYTVPHLALHFPAVRHATLALGAALRTYHLEAAAPPEAEVFALDRYGTAMTLLRAADREEQGVTATTLVCCLVFVVVEALRGNWDDALRHLRAGLAIIDSAVPSAELRALAEPRGVVSGLGLAGELDYVVRSFAALETSACLFRKDFRPVIALKALRAETAAREFRDMGEAHRAVAHFRREVCATAWAWRTGGEAGGGELEARAMQLEGQLRRFREGNALEGPAGVSLGMDVLHFCCSRQLSRRLAAQHPSGPGSPGSYRDEVAYKEILRLIESVKRGIAALAPKDYGRRFMLDVGIVAPAHFVARSCRGARTRERALEMLRGWERRENFWDGPEVGVLLRTGGGGVGEG